MEHQAPAPILSLSKCSKLVHQEIDVACLVHMSLSSELIFGCVHMFATTFEAEQRKSLHQGKDAPCSGATKGTMPSLFFTKIFKKSRQLCRDRSHARKVF
jgi:hypothetical protein